MTAVVSSGVRAGIEETAERLAAAGIEEPHSEAEALVSASLGGTPRHLLYTGERDLTPAERDRLARLIGRRLTGEPLQYITGEAAFRLLTLAMDRRAFIPRPETEGLVEVALQLTPTRVPATVLDAGTGSGAIALSLAVECPAWTVLAVDASPAALELARENAARYDVSAVTWIEADVGGFGFWRHLPPLDLLISNPPYVSIAEWEELPAGIRDFEPAAALLAGPEGMDLIGPILDGASMRVKPGGHIVMEIGETQGEMVRERARRAGLGDLRIAPDLTGRPRYFIATQPERGG